MTKLLDQLFEATGERAQIPPELERVFGLPKVVTEPAIDEAKEPAKLKGKKLEKLISSLYYKHGQNVQVNIFNLSKISDAGKAAYETGGEEAADKAVAAAIAQYREN